MSPVTLPLETDKTPGLPGVLGHASRRETAIGDASHVTLVTPGDASHVTPGDASPGTPSGAVCAWRSFFFSLWRRIRSAPGLIGSSRISFSAPCAELRW
jgi:hypothetical protein